jgi:peroxiredoxin
MISRYCIIVCQAFKMVLLFWCRWSAFVVDGKVKVLNVEVNPLDFKVFGAEHILKQI